MLEKSSLRKRCLILVLLVFGLLLDAAWAQKENVLYSFCKKTNCVDGENPSAGVVLDQKGKPVRDDPEGRGCLQQRLRLSDVASYSRSLQKAMRQSCIASVSRPTAPMGQSPYAGAGPRPEGEPVWDDLRRGEQQNGVCHPAGCGVVFKLTPEGKETVLYRFCAREELHRRGESPAGLVFDQEGNLYGTAYVGGGYNELLLLLRMRCRIQAHSQR